MGGRSCEVETWLARCTAEQRGQVDWLIGQVREVAPAVSEAVKWRRLTLSLDEDWHHWLCAVAVSRRGASLVFHKGTLLADPASLLQGSGRYVRHVDYGRASAAPGALAGLVRDAVAHRTDLLDAPTGSGASAEEAE